MARSVVGSVFHHQFSATTTSPDIVPDVITSDQRLLAKTRLAVIDRVKDSLSLSLYRESGKTLGWFSRDIYCMKANRWVYSHKDPKKYPCVPIAPHETWRVSLGGLTIWTRERLSAEELQETRRLVLKSG
jgi:hypothetical protein